MNKYLIWGMGLLGTSLALDLKKRGHRIIGVEKSEGYLKTISSYGFEGVFHSDDPEIIQTLKDTDGIIIATPVDQVVSILQFFENKDIPVNTWITDMASTKSDLMEKVAHLDLKLNFIGSHPMAGSDLSGPSNAKLDLFSGATIFITPPKNANAEQDRYDQPIQSLREFWSSLGAHPYLIPPDVHDKWAAYLSHGLHLVSCMVSCLLDDIPEVCQMENPPAGGSFRDITRVAGSNPDLWDGIINSNSREVAMYLDSLEKLVKDWKEKLMNNSLPVKDIFQKSANIRSQIIKNNNNKDIIKEGNHGNHRT